jgi:hypothetical protein
MTASPNDALAASLNIPRPRPSLRWRFLRWLGFSLPIYVDLNDLDKDTRFVAGAISQNMHFKLTLRDRFLVLLGGNIAVRNYIKTSHSVERSITRGAWSVIEPGAEF